MRSKSSVILATQKGRSKPVRISSRRWLKLISPPDASAAIVMEEGGKEGNEVWRQGKRRDPCSVTHRKKGEEEVESPQLKVEREALEETPRPVRKPRPTRESMKCEIRDVARKQGHKSRRVPPPGVFLTKSAEAIEKKRVEFLVRAKKCKKAQKSAEESDKKELDSC